MTQHISAEGVPMRGDGTPFPSDPGQWTDEEREYLETYFFNGELQSGIQHEQIATADVPDIQDDGSAYA